MAWQMRLWLRKPRDRAMNREDAAGMVVVVAVLVAAIAVFWMTMMVTLSHGQGSGCIRCDCIHNPNKCK